jgi:hypothetical protein
VGRVAASARRRSRPLRAGRYEHGGGGIRWTLSPRATNRRRGRSHARATAPRPLTLDLGGGAMPGATPIRPFGRLSRITLSLLGAVSTRFRVDGPICPAERRADRPPVSALGLATLPGGDASSQTAVDRSVARAISGARPRYELRPGRPLPSSSGGRERPHRRHPRRPLRFVRRRSERGVGRVARRTPPPRRRKGSVGPGARPHGARDAALGHAASALFAGRAVAHISPSHLRRLSREADR